MGSDNDPMVVLDGQFRVHGDDGLLGVDASVFGRPPSGCTSFPWLYLC